MVTVLPDIRGRASCRDIYGRCPRSRAVVPDATRRLLFVWFPTLPDLHTGLPCWLPRSALLVADVRGLMPLITACPAFACTCRTFDSRRGYVLPAAVAVAMPFGPVTARTPGVCPSAFVTGRLGSLTPCGYRTRVITRLTAVTTACRRVDLDLIR